jgi:predicted AAA+ superfamily ATPase
MIYRNITPVILDALSDSPVVLLNGARQTGKSTLAKWLAQGPHPARYLTFDDATVFAAARNDPAGFLAGIEGNVILDEVQRVPELFMAIKAEVDHNRVSGRFLLTGSTNILLLPRLSESLAGRMEILTLWPFSQGEVDGMRESFVDVAFDDKPSSYKKDTEDRARLIKRIFTGGYPEILKRPVFARRKAWFGSYITTILQRDVRDLANIEGLTEMPRLLSLLATRSASLLNFSELSRSCGIPQSTLKRYMTLLNTTFMITLMPAWSGNLGKRLVKAPKCFLNDTGLTTHLLGIDEGRISDGISLIGPLLENFVVLELLKQSTWSNVQPNLFHFRTQTGHEVDIIMEDSGGRIVGIEIKAAKSLGSKDFRSLQMLQDTLGKRFLRGIVLYTGTEDISFGKNLFALPIQSLWTKY